MFGPWTTLAMLAFESQQVIWMRSMQFAVGGPKAKVEAQRMVAEKVAAGMQASGQLMMGASPDQVMKGYRRKVRANVRRLSR